MSTTTVGAAAVSVATFGIAHPESVTVASVESVALSEMRPIPLEPAVYETSTHPFWLGAIVIDEAGFVVHEMLPVPHLQVCVRVYCAEADPGFDTSNRCTLACDAATSAVSPRGPTVTGYGVVTVTHPLSTTVGVVPTVLANSAARGAVPAAPVTKVSATVVSLPTARVALAGTTVQLARGHAHDGANENCVETVPLFVTVNVCEPFEKAGSSFVALSGVTDTPHGRGGV
ncbi:MAG TPA: hypothetical protein VF118_05220 [Gemmatimonadaceae bacterium]